MTGNRPDDVSVREIARMLNENALSLARALLPAGVEAGGMYHVGSVNGEKGDSLKISLRGTKPGGWADYSLSPGDPAGKGDMLKLVELVQPWSAEQDVPGKPIASAVRWAKGWLGIESMDPRSLDRMRERAARAQAKNDARREGEADRKRKNAAGLWQSGAVLHATPAMAYLTGRGIDFSAIGRLPGAIRFRHDVWHKELARPIPAMLTAGMGLDGVHRVTHAIYLDRRQDGTWDKLPPIEAEGKRLKAAKKIFGLGLGHHFPIHKGRARVPLGRMPEGEALHVAEGMEDALTFAMVFPEARVVAAGTLGNIGAMDLPPQCGDLIILAQRDPPGSKAEAALEAAIAAQQHRARADGSGRRVLCRWPGEGFKDFNDELRGVRL